MVFKHKLFSSSSSKKKKSSESSSSDNSPRSIGSNSPIGSDKKKSKSESGDETWRLNLRSLFAGGKDGSTKKKTDLSSSSSDSDSKPPCDVASKPPLVASSSIGWNRFDSRSDLGSVVPKVVTHLGSGSVPADSGSISADSGSVPADSGSVSAAYGSVPADSGSVSDAYGSGLATSGSVSAASCLVSAAFGSGLAVSGSVSAASGSVSAAFGSVSATSAAYGSVSDAYGSVSAASGSGLAARRSVSGASGSGLPASGSGRGNSKKEAESSSRPALPPSGAGKFKVRPSMSGPIGSSELENSKESESTRYLALLRLTSASRKRFPGDFKSFSQELNSKGLQLFPQWKPRRSSNMEEITNLIRGKFKKAKEEVDSDLLVFGGDLMGLLDSGHELQVEIENLLILARECDKYTSEEFWLKCESIVHELDDRRQELSPGVLKQLHSRMLFILTRCTRLLQFHKESWGQKQEILQLRSVGKRVPTKKAYSQEQHCLDWKEDFASPAPISSPYIETSKDFETPVNIERMSSWKKLPSPVSKGVKEDVVSIAQNNRQTEPTKVVESRVVTSHDNIDVVKLPDCPPRKLSREHVLKDGHNSWGYWGDQSYISEESSIICRICEEEIPTTHVEDHSRICALADKYDQKGVSVNERLFSVAVTLEKLAESFIQKGSLAAVESPDSMKISNASSTGESDVLSPELSDCSRRGSVDMVDCVSEVDSSTSMDDIRSLTSMSCRTRVGPKSDQGMTTSSASCVTPRSPILDPFELFLGGKDTFNEHDDIPKMGELADVARSAANTIPGDEASIQTLLSCIEDSRVVVESRKFDALIVETFGNRIEKLIQEKYLKLCGILVDDKVNLSGTVIDGDAPLDDDVVHSSRTSSVHPRERTSIEDFEMLKPISKGAFGSVFLAKKKITGDLFAIKVLKKADTIRKNAVESILAERDILINAHNPFVVRFFYSFTCRENLYLVMEYLNGGDLYSLLAKIGRLDESIARVYIAELVLALEYIHSQGVVHRDLKPDNLLIAHDGHVKLTDFGLSKVGLINITDDLSGPVFKGESLLVEEKPKVPTSEYQLKRRDKRSVVGTPDYLAPEILLGKGHGATADWWSVGIILYELIVGIPPFNDAQPQQIFDNILNRDIPWPHIPDEMSYEAHDLIDRLLTADPHQRLGAKGAAEVKEHVFFKDINWHTLAEQKAAFVPETESALDTSYFQSRHSMNSSDLKRCRNNENGESSGSSSCLSNHHNDVVNERGDPTALETSVVSPFENFSFKNHMQLAYINIDLMSKCHKDANSVEFSSEISS